MHLNCVICSTKIVRPRNIGRKMPLYRPFTREGSCKACRRPGPHL
ncbi:hypothetical protein DM47_3439 [Burkholderia mallei]|nr:hypothetical protein DM75_2787 [Burkholderia mallei]KOS76101.1 hypothetical protein DM46_2519 [Burkholderia mallei]KOS90303.1 hypothetical protein DM53_4100 [Burkholderia mallei]KOS96869.1 hypothetical protein DM49_3472 [Burkholderia mallei]KOT01729.1 hypothetical protein DM50_3498 [Burkholderia mallei]